jgi:ubiquinone/menaquinone biosynthesis C-methylase UbiE
LEVGCGMGAFTSRLSKMDYNIVGLDISDRMLLNAKYTTKDNYVQGDMEFLPFQDSTFDIVFASASFH